MPFIKYKLNNANNLYFGQNNFRLHVLAKNIKSDPTNIDDNTAALLNILLFSIICKIAVKLYGQNVCDTARVCRQCITAPSKHNIVVYFDNVIQRTPQSTFASLY